MAAPTEATAPSTRRFALDRRHVYILPTRHGLAFGIALLVMLIGAINYANSLGYLLTFLLGGGALVSLLHTYRNMAGLVFRVGEPEPAFDGDRVIVPVSVDNRGGRARFALCLSIPEPVSHKGTPRRWRLKQRETFEVSAFSADANAIAQHAIGFRAPRRGVHELAGLHVSSRFPLGLFRAWSVLQPRTADTASIVYYVYPAPKGHAPLPVPVETNTQRDRVTRRGREDFAGLRDYQRGDPPRHIHWKAVARGQGVPVKEFAGDGSAQIQLDYQDTVGALELRLSQLARWVIDAHAMDLTFAVRLPNTYIGFGSGPRHRRRCLDALAEAPGAQDSD